MTNWDAFDFNLKFQADALREHLISIEAYRLSLNRLHLPKEWKTDLQKLYIVRAVHGTTAIEGNPLSEQEVSRQLARGPGNGRRDQLHRQTENAAAAFRWVEEHFDTPRPFLLPDILTIHKIITTGSDEHENDPGRLRASGHHVTVGSRPLGGVHHPPPGGEVTKRLVGRFLEFVNSRMFKEQHIVVQALVAHFYFVTLHPFGNGNGRATRCIEAAILYSGGYNTYGFYSLSNYFYRNRDDYSRLLQETRTKHRYDLTAFLRFGLTGFREELERINSYVRNRLHRLQYRDLIRRASDKRVGKRRRLLNHREAQLLHGILDASEPSDPFSNEPAKEATGADLERLILSLYEAKTKRTILRELARLGKMGFISVIADGPMRNWRYLLRFEAIEQY
ncbi:MAG TPA: Fic family protein [Gemmataceae bacterium]|nr:Fic family protein [Gemmataceae bacterium]